ncbi:polyubiquitin [Artemisia annua]|uniref:Polyubiquitin n=1 Tax=Artemisia annua TaxID=35608 RepID=A0A2U1QP72_ARTAN|nr:polyubiquitin [Artemisia annua]
MLVYVGHELEDNRILPYYYVQNGSTLRLVDDTSMRGQMLRINVMLTPTGNTIRLEVDSQLTTNKVKAKIQDQESDTVSAPKAA